MASSDIFRRPYVYTRLRDNEIRIAHLQPGEGGNVIVVELSHELLGTGIAPYRALSWEWGEAGKAGVDQTIFVVDKRSTGKENTKQDMVHMGLLMVRPNLFAALKRLRGGKEVRLWIDAICVEQMGTGDDQNADEKNLEKGDQILLMTQIFGTAEDVCIWLGEDGEGDDSAQAIGFIKKLSNLQDMDVVAELKRGTCDVNDLIAFMKLLKRGWFGRRWIVQEVAMARSATLYSGKESISWPQFAAAVSLLEAVGRDGSLNKILTRIPELNNPAEYIGNTSSMPAYRLIQKATGEPHGPEQGVGACRYTFEELVSWMGAFKASRLHDTIYAIVGLACDVRPEPPTTGRTQTPGTNPKAIIRRHTMGLGEKIRPFKVDYSIEPLVVFKKFIQHVTNKSGSLDILCRPWAPSSGTDARDKATKIELPSWIASLDRKPFQPNRYGNMVRCNPDPIVGPAGFGRRRYSASGLVEFNVLFPEIENPDSKTMIVKGFTLDTIRHTYECGLFGNVPGDWLVAGGWEKETDIPPKELWRTLVAGRDSHGNDAESWYPLAFQSSVKERGIRYGFETRSLTHNNTNSRVAELFRRVRAVVWNRRLIRTRGEYLTWDGKNTHARESLGLAPDGARTGDLICIIFGCSVPLVLRPRESPHSDIGQTIPDAQEDDASGGRSTPIPAQGKINPMNSEEHYYSLIGECYIDHMMDGEAIGYFQEAKEKVQDQRYRLV